MSRDIFIKPNRGATGPNLYPEIAFSGTSSITPIKLKVDDDGSVLFTGTYGVLFNISDNKDGLLHSVNDVSGLPILSVYSYDYVQMGKWDKNTLIVNSDSVGVGLTAPSTKFHIYATTSGAFRLQDTTEGLNRVLTSDVNGVGTWQSMVSLGVTNKSTNTRGFTASITETITHNLNTTDVIVQNYDSTGLQIIAGSVLVTGTGSVNITFSQTLSNVKTILIG